MASKCSSKRKSCISLISSKKLEMIKLSEESTLKAKIVQADFPARANKADEYNLKLMLIYHVKNPRAFKN
ncbi:hypothetical protein QTO34_013791 [Cnephaeus nilssonii]|uniref:Uncharacterized protein n=1 Tax=Cnephaeus nilssonii TaxID=3371016 RepID=A0AA40I8X7_CNENI|nr:hypothetical protein QTO34_013791 [Eptesicus nilssonii]